MEEEVRKKRGGFERGSQVGLFVIIIIEVFFEDIIVVSEDSCGADELLKLFDLAVSKDDVFQLDLSLSDKQEDSTSTEQQALKYIDCTYLEAKTTSREVGSVTCKRLDVFDLVR